MRLGIIALLSGLGLASTASLAADTGAIVGGAIGGGAGAAIGDSMGGRNGAIIGGAIGGGAGAAIGSRPEPSETVIVHEHRKGDNGKHRGHRKHKHKGKGKE